MGTQMAKNIFIHFVLPFLDFKRIFQKQGSKLGYDRAPDILDER